MADQDKAVLIVDDSPFIVARLRTMLEGIPLIGAVMQAGSYEEARPLLATQKPGIVLLDINLPDTNGIELLRYIKRYDPSIIVIMLSNQSGEFYRIRCKALGASHFMDKSTEFDQVPCIIASFL
jgi:DNA-binding NarL/FixJ family response regulator